LVCLHLYDTVTAAALDGDEPSPGADHRLLVECDDVVCSPVEPLPVLSDLESLEADAATEGRETVFLRASALASARRKYAAALLLASPLRSA